jgi:bifunctional non-homologous end joining protein LigD
MPRKRLAEYEAKRSFSKTPEPAGKGRRATAAGGRFVIQEHHARRLHWDLRLERDGVLVSWALPKGVPTHPEQNHLAVRTEDHPLEYLEFHGEIPKGQYGAGTMEIWDRGTYEAEKFRDDKVIVTFHGERVRGKYALFPTRGKDWLIHRMDPPEDPGRSRMPEHLKPMLATIAPLPSDEKRWAFEIKWDGARALAYCRPGEIRLESRNLLEVTSQYPEIRGILEQLGVRDAILDGEVVAFDPEGRPSFGLLQRRMHVASEASVRRRMKETPVTYVVFDLLFLDGRALFEMPYVERRALLDELGLDGPSWQTPRHHTGDGAALLDLARQQGLEGIVAKRLDSRYEPGRRSSAWRKVKNFQGQELVIGGWLPGKGRRSGAVGALLVGYHDADGDLRYAGRVGTGFNQEMLRLLQDRLAPLARKDSPFTGRQPPKEARFVEPELVCEVAFSEWTAARTLRAPSFKGLREDKDPADVVLEGPEASP